MIIDCVADLHGFYPKMEGGDVLIVAGDLTKSDQQWQYLEFRNWLRAQDYKHKIIICGNHDGCIEKGTFYFNDEWLGATYLRDQGTEIDGLKFWGSPWTNYFEQVNPHCAAFMRPDKQLSETWKKIPQDIDVLITHCPPFGIRDWIPLPHDGTIFHAGSKTLVAEMGKRKKVPKLWVWGHIHEAYGEDLAVRGKECKMINCSYVNERYEPVNKPIRIIL
jgi:Icc-related predicted phosphoesterase